MSMYISETVKSAVIERAFDECEYCRLQNSFAFHNHEADHVVPIKHGGETIFENLALSCWSCNRHKGSDVGSFDFEADGSITRFFNPRIDGWAEHFRLEKSEIVPLTAIARVTIKILRMNGDDRIEERSELIEAGLYE